jgi:hypothetical protein
MLKASVGGGAASSTRYRHPLLAAMSGLLAVLPARRARRWSALTLALAALLMSWDDGPTLLDRFMAARALLGRGCGGTYQGLAKALARHGAGLVGTLRRHLAGLVRGQRALWTIEGWMLFAIDSSRFDLPRTLDNDTALGVPSRRGSLPQLLATLMVHLGSGVVWDWRLTHCQAGERRGMLAMLAALPRGALLVADAGFVGHECLSAVVRSGRHVLVRLAGNAVLITGLTRRADIVAVWPRDGQDRTEPLLLRVVRVQGRAGGEVVLGTSVLDKKLLSDAQAALFYRLRWGVEVCYRSLKQTLRRRKLLSASPARAVRELHWVMLGVMVLGLLTLTRLSPRLDRRRWSVAAAARAVRHAARARTGAVAHRHLSTLRDAVCGDNRRARKKAWEWPHKKNPGPPGPPLLRRATRAEVALWRSLSRQRA